MNFMIDSRPERNYKDRLFKAIFGRDTEQSKQWRLELYNALNGTSYTDPDALKINTIENVIYLTMRNDISFLVDSQMTLYEQQSTYNPNMPLRGLMYFAQLYQMHLSQQEKDLFRSTLINIPNPQFVVFYNGIAEKPDKTELRLSDAFEIPEKSGSFEWTATMININKNHNCGLQKNCKPLYDYIQYASRIAENKKNGMSAKEAVTEALDWAISEKLLGGFFKQQKEEVLSMSLTEFDEEIAIRGWREDGIEEGISIGEQRKAVEAAKKFLEDGRYSAQEISELLGIPIESFVTTTA
jgi:hypothetical protein